ncbi:MAG: hypothetical protein IJ177_09610 [Fibrobacter sp.]|nr:hypothetical protein [Fibrobacter sp.]MBQ9226428.1 hypothetical protein [Fibrobacter sp.]
MNVEQEIKKLQQKISDLENRIQKLESPKQVQAPSANEGAVGIIYQGRVR